MSLSDNGGGSNLYICGEGCETACSGAGVDGGLENWCNIYVNVGVGMWLHGFVEG